MGSGFGFTSGRARSAPDSVVDHIIDRDVRFAFRRGEYVGILEYLRATGDDDDKRYVFLWKLAGQAPRELSLPREEFLAKFGDI